MITPNWHNAIPSSDSVIFTLGQDGHCIFHDPPFVPANTFSRLPPGRVSREIYAHVQASRAPSIVFPALTILSHRVRVNRVGARANSLFPPTGTQK